MKNGAYHWVKSTLRDRPGLRALTLRAGSLVRGLSNSQPGVYTLCYHRVPESLQDRFANQLGYLKRHGDFIDIDTACERLASGWEPRERLFVVSFDDGYADTREVAMPVLTGHGIPAVVFLVSDWIDTPPRDEGGPRYMNQADIAAWLAAGMQIGSHGAQHRRFSQLTTEEARQEFARSRRDLGARAGREIRHFACPWGVAGHDFDPGRDPALAREVGYETFFTTRRGRGRHADDLFLMPRHVVEPHWSTSDLEVLLGASRLTRLRDGTA